MEGIRVILQFKKVVSQKSEDLDHPGWSKEGGKKFIENTNGILWLFELGVTDSHSKFGFIDKWALWKICD